MIFNLVVDCLIILTFVHCVCTMCIKEIGILIYNLLSPRKLNTIS